jgi:hypothetical protein
VTVTTTVSGAVALLLYGARAGREIDDSLVEAILALRELVGPETRELVDRWIADGGPDGEQIYCLDHLLRERFIAEPRFQASVEDVVHTGQVTKDAVTALSEHCRREGFRGAHAWCQTALTVPAVLGQAPPVPVNRTVTAPR